MIHFKLFIYPFKLIFRLPLNSEHIVITRYYRCFRKQETFPFKMLFVSNRYHIPFRRYGDSKRNVIFGNRVLPLALRNVLSLCAFTNLSHVRGSTVDDDSAFFFTTTTVRTHFQEKKVGHSFEGFKPHSYYTYYIVPVYISELRYRCETK